MFRLYTGKPTVKNFGKSDTTVRIVRGGAVQLSTAGKLRNLANDSDDKLLGVAQRTAAITDTADITVILAAEDVVWDVETDSDGGAAATDVGRYCAIDTGNTTDVNAVVDISDSDIPHFFITEVVSATRVRGILARTALRKPATHDLDT